ncbi:unnamed protein product [Arctogadus glacialis]
MLGCRRPDGRSRSITGSQAGSKGNPTRSCVYAAPRDLLLVLRLRSAFPPTASSSARVPRPRERPAFRRGALYDGRIISDTRGALRQRRVSLSISRLVSSPPPLAQVITRVLSVPHRRLVCCSRLFEVTDVGKAQKQAAHQREVFLFNDLIVILKLCPKKKSSAAYTFCKAMGLLGMQFHLFENEYYPHGISILSPFGSDRKQVLNFCAPSAEELLKFLEDLKESIAEVSEMEQIRIEWELEKQQGSKTHSAKNNGTQLELRAMQGSPSGHQDILDRSGHNAVEVEAAGEEDGSVNVRAKSLWLIPRLQTYRLSCSPEPSPGSAGPPSHQGALFRPESPQGPVPPPQHHTPLAEVAPGTPTHHHHLHQLHQHQLHLHQLHLQQQQQQQLHPPAAAVSLGDLRPEALHIQCQQIVEVLVMDGTGGHGHVEAFLSQTPHPHQHLYHHQPYPHPHHHHHLLHHGLQPHPLLHHHHHHHQPYHHHSLHQLSPPATAAADEQQPPLPPPPPPYNHPHQYIPPPDPRLGLARTPSGSQSML